MLIAGPDQVYDPKGVKARMIRQFANFAEWPSNTFANPKTPLVMGFIANDVTGEAVLGQLRDRFVSNHPLEVRSCKDPEEAKGCQLLYFSRSSVPKSQVFLTALEGRVVLTVGEGGDFLEMGGMITIVEEKDHLGFDVNLVSVQRARLGLNAQMLQIARAVRR